MQNRLPFLLPIAAAALASLLVAGCRDDGVEMVGYYKSNRGDRVIAYYAQETLDDAEAMAVLVRAPTTEGRSTVAVLYDGTDMVPGDDLTGASSFPAAMGLLGEKPFDGWAHRLRVNAGGARTFD